MQTLTVRYRGKEYQVPVCLDAKRVEEVQALWPGGVVDVEASLADGAHPARHAGIGDAMRRDLLRMVRGLAGEPIPGMFLPWGA